MSVPEPVPFGRTSEREDAAARVAAHLAADGIVAYPTETIYGFGCALRPAALETLARFKGDRPFLLLIRGPDDAPGLRWTDAARRLAERFWPGPLTLALDADGRYPRQVLGPDGAVAVRVSPHPAIRPLLDAAGGPVTSTSANRPGEPPALDAAAAAAAAREMPGVLVLDGGPLPPAPPSTIVRCGDETRLIREGAVRRSEIETLVELQ